MAQFTRWVGKKKQNSKTVLWHMPFENQTIAEQTNYFSNWLTPTVYLYLKLLKNYSILNKFLLFATGFDF